MIYSLFLAYHIYGMIRRFYQLCVRFILLFVVIFLIIANWQKLYISFTLYRNFCFLSLNF